MIPYCQTVLQLTVLRDAVVIEDMPDVDRIRASLEVCSQQLNVLARGNELVEIPSSYPQRFRDIGSRLRQCHDTKAIIEDRRGRLNITKNYVVKGAGGAVVGTGVFVGELGLNVLQGVGSVAGALLPPLKKKEESHHAYYDGSDDARREYINDCNHHSPGSQWIGFSGSAACFGAAQDGLFDGHDRLVARCAALKEIRDNMLDLQSQLTHLVGVASLESGRRLHQKVDTMQSQMSDMDKKLDDLIGKIDEQERRR